MSEINYKKTYSDSWLDKQIKEGNAFFYRSYTTLGVITTYNAIKTPATKELYYNTTVNSSDETILTMYEGGTFTGGNVVPLIHNKRESIKTINTLFYDTTISVTSPGTALLTAKSISGNPVSVKGGILSLPEYIILKRNTTYIFKTESLASGNLLNFSGILVEIG